MVRALDLDRANAAPGSYVEVPASGPAPLAAGTSQPILSRREGRAFEPTMLARC
jgi:hypothetical protein